MGRPAYGPAGLEKDRYDKQVLRYRWPSMCNGWALGLANFVTGRLLGSREDREVLWRLVETVKEGSLRVLIISGSEDRLVPVGNTRRVKNLLRCPLVLLKGLGHVAHEEDPKSFVN